MKASACVLLAGSFVSAAAYAGKGPPPPLPGPVTTATTTPTQAHKTSVYGGLKWDLPGPLAPQLVVGVRHAKTQSDGDTFGVDFSFAFFFFESGFKPGKLRLKGFTGNEHVQGEIGAGWDFSKGAFFAGPSVNIPYVNLGVDWVLGSGLQPYGMIHTFGKPGVPPPNTVATMTAAPPAPPVPDS